MKMDVTEVDMQTLEMMGGAVNSGTPDAAQPGRTLVSLRNAHIDWYNDFIRRAHAPPTPPPGMLDLGVLSIGSTPWTMIAPGQVAFIRATVDGLVSCSASSGGFYCWGNVNPSMPGTFPLDETVTLAGTGTAPRLAIKAGMFYSFKHDSPTEQSMHASIEG